MIYMQNDSGTAAQCPGCFYPDTYPHIKTYPEQIYYKFISTPCERISMIPLMLDISESRVLVFGNGAVGSRKAQYFSGEAKEVTVLDKAASPEEEAEALSRIGSYDYIIAATDDAAFNAKVCAIAKEAKKWYNSATGTGNFLIPAAFKSGDVSIGISTNGKAPAAAAFIRDELRKTTSNHPLSRMIELQETLRRLLPDVEPSQEKRAEILKSVLKDKAVWKDLADGKEPDIEELLRRYQ